MSNKISIPLVYKNFFDPNANTRWKGKQASCGDLHKVVYNWSNSNAIGDLIKRCVGLLDMAFSDLLLTPLHVATLRAVQNPSELANKTIKQLIDGGANTRATDVLGNTILHYSAMSHNRDLGKYLTKTLGVKNSMRK